MRDSSLPMLVIGSVCGGKNLGGKERWCASVSKCYRAVVVSRGIREIREGERGGVHLGYGHE